MINIATTKIWKINQRIDKVINYIANDVKTENKAFVTGINTTLDNSVSDMNLTKRRFNKQDGILGYHCYQSFKGKEISNENAHQLGIDLANELWGDRFQVIVTTHTNTKNIHNHFFINSVSFVDGKKLYNNKENLAILRETSDNLCTDYGLKVLKENSYYNTFSASYNRKDKYTNIVKEDINLAISKSRSYDQFLKYLRIMGYTINQKKQYETLSIRKEPYRRNIRVERTFGEEYSVNTICERIRSGEVIASILPVIKIEGRYISLNGTIRKKKRKISSLRALYYHYCYLFKIFSDKKEEKLSEYQKRGARRLER